MSFWDDALPILGSIGGGLAGSFVGMPGVGAALGGKVGQWGAGAIDSANSPDPNTYSKGQVDLYDKLTGELPTYQGLPPGQGLMPQDIAAMEKARSATNQVAAGREGALEQQDAASSGGASRSGKLLAAQVGAGQAAVGRLNEFDLGQAGIASERDLQNRAMLNDFNQRNMMNKIQIASGKAGAMNRAQDYGERSRYANSQNIGNAFNALGSAGMYDFGRSGSSGDTFQGGGSPSSINTGAVGGTGGGDYTDILKERMFS